ncbi:hypothetical protein F7725_025818, partial [Dissostichus mawsoni]
MGITYSVQRHGDHLLCPDAWGSPTLSRRMGITYSVQTHVDYIKENELHYSVASDASNTGTIKCFFTLRRACNMHCGFYSDSNENHILKVFSDCIEALEAKSFSIISVFKVLTELKGKLERRLKDTFFGFAVNNKLKQLTPDLAKKCEADFLVFYERAKKYVSERYDFSENSFHSKVSTLGLTTAVSYGEYSDAVQACSLKDIDMDGLYEEYGMVEAILSSSEMEGCHSEERYLKLFSKAEVPLLNLRKVSAYIFSIPCSNAHTERVFSMMTSAWRNERNRLDVDSVKAELHICVNFTF